MKKRLLLIPAVLLGALEGSMETVEASAVNVENEFLYSDHNPVILTFSLKE